MIRKMVHGSPFHDFGENPLGQKRNITIKKISCGSVHVRQCDMYGVRERSKEEVPVFAYLVNHKERGYFLIDAGLDSSFHTRRRGSQRGLFAPFVGIEGELEEGRTLANYLKNRSISLSGVFLSHLHFDHIAGLRDFPSVKACYVGQGEPYNPHKPLYYGNYLKHINELREINFSLCDESSLLPGLCDFFGDGSFLIFPTPGHSKGHISFLINGKETRALVTGDSWVYNRPDCLVKGAGKFSADKKGANTTLDLLVSLSKKYPDLVIHTGHGE